MIPFKSKSYQITDHPIDEEEELVESPRLSKIARESPRPQKIARESPRPQELRQVMAKEFVPQIVNLDPSEILAKRRPIRKSEVTSQVKVEKKKKKKKEGFDITWIVLAGLAAGGIALFMGPSNASSAPVKF